MKKYTEQELRNYGYPLARDMITRSVDVPGYMAASPEQRDQIWDRFVSGERGKKYLAVSVDGDLVLIQNPITWGEKYENGRLVRVRRSPEPLSVIGEAYRPKAERKSTLEANF